MNSEFSATPIKNHERFVRQDLQRIFMGKARKRATHNYYSNTMDNGWQLINIQADAIDAPDNRATSIYYAPAIGEEKLVTGIISGCEGILPDSHAHVNALRQEGHSFVSLTQVNKETLPDHKKRFEINTKMTEWFLYNTASSPLHTLSNNNLNSLALHSSAVEYYLDLNTRSTQTAALTKDLFNHVSLIVPYLDSSRISRPFRSYEKGVQEKAIHLAQTYILNPLSAAAYNGIYQWWNKNKMLGEGLIDSFIIKSATRLPTHIEGKTFAKFGREITKRLKEIERIEGSAHPLHAINHKLYIAQGDDAACPGTALQLAYLLSAQDNVTNDDGKHADAFRFLADAVKPPSQRPATQSTHVESGHTLPEALPSM